MEVFDKIEYIYKTFSKISTYSVPFISEIIKDNIIINTKSSIYSRDQLIKKAIDFHSQGNISKAVEYYQYCIDDGCNDFIIFLNYGSIMINLGKFKEAEIFTRKAIKLKPDFFDALLTLGSILIDLGKFKEAEIFTRKAININPNSADGISNLGAILMYLESTNEAIEVINKAISISPDNPELYRDLSICFSILGNQDLALLNIKKANNYNSNDQSSKILLTIMLGWEKRKNKELNPILNKKIIPPGKLENNPLILHRSVEKELINFLYKMKLRDQEKYQEPTYGSAVGSDYMLFDSHNKMIVKLKNDISSLLREAVKSEVLIVDSFFTIFRSGGGLKSHCHLNRLDKIRGLNIARQKFSMVYYLSIGDQDCDEPGILKLDNPNQDILPKDGLIIIFPSDRLHSVSYKGKIDRVIVGVNFYSIY